MQFRAGGRWGRCPALASAALHAEGLPSTCCCCYHNQQTHPPTPLCFLSTQGFIPFSQSRADTASIARRKAATAAIAARSYMPPMAQAPPAPARGLAGPSTAAQQAAPKRQQQAAPQRTGSGLARSTSGQPSLFDFGEMR